MMSNELTKQNTAIETRPDEQPSILAVIARAAADPQVDVAKMQALLDLQERVMTKQAEQAFNEAMTRLQPKLPRITKHGRVEIPAKDDRPARIQSRYARYEDIDEAVRPLLCEEGFSIAFDSEFGDKLTMVKATLSHVQGHHKTASIPLPLDTSGAKNNTQAMGSVISYGRRYLLCMLLNIITVDEDNDGLGDPINQDQQNKINDLLLATESNRKKFLEVMGAAEVDKIPKGDYERALKLLDRKARHQR